MNIEPKLWDDIIQDWDKLPIDTYKFIFSQSEKMFDEVESESISITEKSINILKLLFGSITVFIGILLTKGVVPNIYICILTSVPLCVAIFYSLKLQLPRPHVFKGSKPETTLISQFDNPIYTNEDKERLVYYHELIRYHGSINFLEFQNSIRHPYYKKALIFSAITIIGLAMALVQAISCLHP